MAAVTLAKKLQDDQKRVINGNNYTAPTRAAQAAQPQQQTASQYSPKTYQGVALAQTAQQNPYEGPYNILGASAKAQKGLTDYGERYAPSKTVQDARAYLQQVMDAKPGGNGSMTDYSSQIAGAYSAAVPTREKFQYDVNKDPMFQQYKNQYMNLGQRAMQDTVGNAAALTGGYGSSVGTTAGYQAYQQYLQQLNGIVPQLEEQAWQRYKYEGDEARANAAAAASAAQADYNRYRDTVADWQADRAFAAQLYGQEHDWDYNDWTGLQDYYLKLAQLENGDFWRTADTLEDNRRFDANLDMQRYSTDLDDRYRWGTLAEQGRQFDADDLYRYATLAEQGRTTDLDDRYRYATLAANQQEQQQALAYQAYKDQMDDAYRWGSLEEGGRQADAELAYRNRVADIEDAFNRDQLSAQERQQQMQLAYQQYIADQENAYKYAALGENGRQYDLAYGLDRDKFDFEVQQYMNALAQAGAGYGGGSGGSKAQTEQTTRNLTGAPPLNPSFMQAYMDTANGKMPSAETLAGIGQTPESYAKSLKDMAGIYRRSVAGQNAAAKAAKATGNTWAANQAGIHDALSAKGAAQTDKANTVGGFTFENAAQAEAFKRLFGNGGKSK